MAVFEPATGEAGALETLAQVPIAAHHAPDQIAPIVLDHRQDRPLVVANLDLAHIEKNVAVAQYELAIQTAFREVSDALSARGTYVEQHRAQEELVTADAEAFRLAQMRFRSGVDSYLTTLDAERSLYSAQQGLVTVRQAELANEVTLYNTLGGGWRADMGSGG